MNRNRLLLIGVVALALAGSVSFLLYRTVLRITTANKNTPPQDLITVVAAASDLSVGTRLQEKDLRLVQLPAGSEPPGIAHSTTEVVGRGVIIPMAKNELVLSSKLASENAGAGLPSIIPDGMRAVSVKVNDVIQVAGFVIAGTRVDVILTGSPNRDNDPANVTSVTVLENVQVLAAGQKLQHNENGEPQQVAVITLLVNPQDAQKLVLASSEGRIQLALRNPLDTNQQEIPSTKNAALYRIQPAAPQPVRHVVKVAAAPAAPAPFMVEMIRGDKRDSAKF
jgi:pilus assembly protein CpaB